MYEFDIIVLGGGPAGFTAANRAAEKGAKVALFEAGSLGGVCLNEGCIPSKSFLHSSLLSSYGASDEFRNRIALKNESVAFLRNGIRGNLRKNKVSIIFSHGKILSYSDSYIVIEDSEGKNYSAKHLIIATGSSCKIPDISGLKKSLNEGFAVTTHELFDADENFERIAIIGGGIVGVEMASCFLMAGKQVYLIESSAMFCSNLDSSCSEYVENKLKTLGVNVLKSASVSSICDNEVNFECDNRKNKIQCDRVLISVGRCPNVTDLGLENLPLDITKNGCIATNERLETALKGIYAVGDVNGKSMLAHTAYREAEVCINNIFGLTDCIDYSLIPTVLYGVAELASVGRQEEELKKLGISGFYKKIPATFSGRSVAEHFADYGFCKLVFDSNETFCGAIICSAYASEIILSLSVMLNERVSLSRMKEYVYPHPTAGELIREALYAKKIEF